MKETKVNPVPEVAYTITNVFGGATGYRMPDGSIKNLDGSIVSLTPSGTPKHKLIDQITIGVFLGVLLANVTMRLFAGMSQVAQNVLVIFFASAMVFHALRRLLRG
jgi:hypothetical protein